MVLIEYYNNAVMISVPYEIIAKSMSIYLSHKTALENILVQRSPIQYVVDIYIII